MARKSAAGGSKPARSPSRNREATTPTSTTSTDSPSAPPVPPKPAALHTKPVAKKDPQTVPEIVQSLVESYKDETPVRIRLLDTFLVFLVVVAVLQFVYCVIGGNYPFNAFLAGFSATVGQFVLTVSLRMQSVTANRKEFKEVSPERAFADFVLGSLLLHVFCVNFIN